MTRAELHEIVEQLPDDALEGASILLKRVAARQIDPDQTWCWTDEWQEKLRASLEDVDRGRLRSYQTAEGIFGSVVVRLPVPRNADVHAYRKFPARLQAALR